ncbi:hypothetical protein [Chitinimonas naiadis]
MNTRFDALLEPVLVLATGALFGLALLSDIGIAGKTETGAASARQVAQVQSVMAQA